LKRGWTRRLRRLRLVLTPGRHARSTKLRVVFLAVATVLAGWYVISILIPQRALPVSGANVDVIVYPDDGRLSQAVLRIALARAGADGLVVSDASLFARVDCQPGVPSAPIYVNLPDGGDVVEGRGGIGPTWLAPCSEGKAVVLSDLRIPADSLVQRTGHGRWFLGLNFSDGLAVQSNPGSDQLTVTMQLNPSAYFETVYGTTRVSEPQFIVWSSGGRLTISSAVADPSAGSLGQLRDGVLSIAVGALVGVIASELWPRGRALPVATITTHKLRRPLGLRARQQKVLSSRRLRRQLTARRKGVAAGALESRAAQSRE
jgi:hypothetical protein